MIEQKTETAIACDVCGKAIAEGETWYQLVQSVTCATFDGTLADLRPASTATMQLCELHYRAQELQLDATATTAQRTSSPPPPPQLVTDLPSA